MLSRKGMPDIKKVLVKGCCILLWFGLSLPTMANGIKPCVEEITAFKRADRTNTYAIPSIEAINTIRIAIRDLWTQLEAQRKQGDIKVLTDNKRLKLDDPVPFELLKSFEKFDSAMELSQLKCDPRYWMLSDASKAPKGWGRYLINTQYQVRGLLQAPHQFTDLHTGELATQMFFQSQLQALALNTARRDSAPNSRADMARATDSIFYHFSKEYASEFPFAYIVQLHGFSNKKRKSISGQRANMIISAGLHQPGAMHRWLQQCMEGIVGNDVLLYPQQVRELGGTKNPLSQLYQRMNSPRFVHWEVNRAWRNRLMQRPVELEQASACLAL